MAKGIGAVDILKVLIVVMLVQFPLLEIARFTLFAALSTTLTDGIVLLQAFVFAMVFLLKKKKVEAKLARPIAAFVAVSALSLIVNAKNLPPSEFVNASLYLVRWIFYAVVYFVVLSFNKTFIAKLKIVLAAAGSIVVAGGYMQYFFYPDLRNLRYLGWDEHLYRMFGSFLDPNFAGAFFVLFFFFLLALLKRYGPRPRNRTTLIGICILSLLAVFLTYSRSALLMLLVSFSLFLILIQKKRWILLFLLAFAIAIFVLPKSFKTEGTNVLRVASSKARIESVARGLQIFSNNPLLGVGFNAYRFAQHRYGFLTDRDLSLTHAGAGVENSFVFVLATTGIVGFVSYAYLLWSIIKGTYKQGNMFSATTTASIGGMLISALFINSLFYPPLMLWLWILIGITERT